MTRLAAIAPHSGHDQRRDGVPALFSARVTHHLILTTLAAPLIAYALPGARGLVTWAVVHAGIFWAWHAPQAYSLALASDAGYWFMQLTLLGSAVGLWRAVQSIA